MVVPTFTKTGAKSSVAAKLNKDVFSVSVDNHELVKAAYVGYLANGRANLAVTKTRGLVRGGGRKPWRQKGTGRARFGSTRNPIWRTGGIVFGPTGIENYSHKLNTSAKHQAIRQALSLAHIAKKLIVVDDMQFKAGKTAEAASFLNKIDAKGNILLIVADKTPELVRATSNLQNIKLVQARYTNVYDVMNASSIVMTAAAHTAISEWLGGKK
jgi:large subunit ribosomal protein L4